MVEKVPLIGVLQTTPCNYCGIPLYNCRDISINQHVQHGKGDITVAKKAKEPKAKEAGARKRRSGRSPEQKISHSVNHSVRLDAFLATFEAVTSPSEVAKLLRKPVATVSFHMTELRKDGAIELVKTEQRRGAIEHYYRATRPPEVDAEEWKALPKSSRRKIAALGLQAVIADSLASLRHGKLEDDEDMYLVWMPMRLNEEGRDKVTDLQAEMLERMVEIEEAYGIPEGDEEDVGMRVATMLWFERGQPGAWRPRDTRGISDPE
jgi:DNA-binding transcriptional ArsR family regulator